MALDKETLENSLKDRIKGVDLLEADVASEVAKVVAEEVHNYLEPLVIAYNSHTHSDVITSVSGGSGSPAVGVTGNSGTTSDEV